MSRFNFPTILLFWETLVFIAASIVNNTLLFLRPVAANACISFGKQEPPNPGPGCKNFELMRPSTPIARATS